MNNSLQPNGNHINKDAITSDEEEKKEETKDEIVPGYDDDEEQQETPPTPRTVHADQIMCHIKYLAPVLNTRPSIDAHGVGN